jgi:hypothetical protein
VLADQLLASPQAESSSATVWLQRWWSHARVVSLVAGALADALKIDPHLARCAGMIHEIGRLLLLTGSDSAKVIACYELAGGMAFPTTLAEQIFLGVNHQQIGQEYIRRQSLPDLLTEACVCHDLNDAQLAQFPPARAALAALICAADRIAKASGFLSVPNEELLPLPGSLAEIVSARSQLIDAALDEARNTILFRLGAAYTPIEDQPILAGVKVAFISSTAGSWNTYQRALVQAGATVESIQDAGPDVACHTPPDLILADGVSSKLQSTLLSLKQLGRTMDLAATPVILLAQRSDEPEFFLNHHGLSASIYPSPIRYQTFLKAVRHMADNRPVKA